MTIQCEEEGCACIDWEIPFDPEGTYACPWCGLDKPHPHTDEELLRLKVRKASQKAFERWFDGGVRQFRDVGMHWAWRQDWRARFGGNGFMIGGQTYYSAATEMHWATWLRGAWYGAEYRNAEIEGLRAALAPAAERERQLKEMLEGLDRAVNAWIGLEAPRMKTDGKHWRQLEITRAHIRRFIAKERNDVEG